MERPVKYFGQKNLWSQVNICHKTKNAGDQLSLHFTSAIQAPLSFRQCLWQQISVHVFQQSICTDVKYLFLLVCRVPTAASTLAKFHEMRYSSNFTDICHTVSLLLSRKGPQFPCSCSRCYQTPSAFRLQPVLYWILFQQMTNFCQIQRPLKLQANTNLSVFPCFFF